MPSCTPLARLLIVDDESAQMKALCHTLQEHGYVTTGFASAEEALAGLKAGNYDLLLTDLMMPGTDGIGLLQAALAIDPDLVGIVMTGHGTIDTAVEAMKSGALDYILKPFKLSAILPVLSRALTVRGLRLENAELAQRVRDRTAELEFANQELEAFSYSVSHDLRAPLRQIDGFSQILMTGYQAELPEKARHLLDNVREGAQKMGQLIDDLLNFSRLGRQPLARRPLNLSSLVGEILAEMQQEAPGRPMEIHVDPLPECVGDPALLRQVFTNLLGNAFKFTRGKNPAVIDVGCQEQSGELIFRVADNGAGFDMQYAKKLFGVFQRLHRADEFEGTGVGLSIVQRIIHRHGGRIWAEAAPGRGATFCFTLPAAS